LTLIISASFLVVLSTNPVLSVLYLVLVYLFVALLLGLIGLDFIAVLLLVLYAGAVMVLFLFSIMLLVRVKDVQSDSLSFWDFFFIMIGLECSSFLNLFLKSDLPYEKLSDVYLFSKNLLINDLAFLLFVYCFHIVVLLGFILLLAMIGSIFLTLFHQPDVKRQVIFEQLSRDNNILYFSKKDVNL
jgi:NADH-quinone oxidoreductase subunit J